MGAEVLRVDAARFELPVHLAVNPGSAGRPANPADARPVQQAEVHGMAIVRDTFYVAYRAPHASPQR